MCNAQIIKQTVRELNELPSWFKGAALTRLLEVDAARRRSAAIEKVTERDKDKGDTAVVNVICFVFFFVLFIFCDIGIVYSFLMLMSTQQDYFSNIVLSVSKQLRYALT